MNLDRSIIRFFLSSVWPLIIILLFLSIGLNAFFLILDRFTASSSNELRLPPATVPSDDSFARGPEAFGRVERGFVAKSQGSTKDATLPVRSYVRGTVPFPTIPATMMLYRDQGYEIDRTLIETVFRGLRVPEDVLSNTLFAKSLTLRSVDFSSTVTLDAERRVFTVTRTVPTSSTPSATPADDVELTAIAKEFAGSLGIDPKDFGTPVVKDVRDQQGGTKTFVVWYALFDGLPLIDADLEPLERLTVQVHRPSRAVLSVRLNLLNPGSLVRSAYPTASAVTIDRSLASGGLLPVDSRLSGTPVTAEFSSFDLAYMVIAPDKEFPLYIAPVLRAKWSMKPACKGCVLSAFQTYVPVLDPSTFQWTRSMKSSAPSPASVSSVASASVASLRSSSAPLR